jgi:hypothetical protein
MKIGIDTIFYIILAVVILATTLNKKRKKTARQQVPLKDQTGEEDLLPGMKAKSFSPADFLKQAMMEAAGIEEQQLYKPEAESLEQIIDEEENVPEETKVRVPERKEKPLVSRHTPEPESSFLVTEGQEEKKLFRDPDEIKKAIIFSEVLKRPDY